MGIEKLLIKSLFFIGWFKFILKLILLNIDDHLGTKYLQWLFKKYHEIEVYLNKRKKIVNEILLTLSIFIIGKCFYIWLFFFKLFIIGD